MISLVVKLFIRSFNGGECSIRKAPRMLDFLVQHSGCTTIMFVFRFCGILIIGDNMKQLNVNGYVIEVHQKQMKNMYLKIKPNGQIIVSAPLSLEMIEIEAFVKRKMAWLVPRVEAVKQQQKQIEINEELKLFGQVLEIEEVVGLSERVSIQENKLRLTSPKKLTEKRKQVLIQLFLQQQLEAAVSYYIALYQPKLKGVPSRIEVKYREMKSTWGVCRPSRKSITFNKKLVHHRLAFLEYVVVHELCHFLHPHHQAPFYRSVSSVLPDFESRRRP